VSIQLIPDATACRIAATDSSSSCGPHAAAQSPPPIAQAPNPTLVISMPVVPSSAVVSDTRPPVLAVAGIFAVPRSNCPVD
jgi:hypothetical protein